MKGKSQIQETMQEVQSALDNLPKPKTASQQIAIGLVIALLGAFSIRITKRVLGRLNMPKKKKRNKNKTRSK